jgi:hypothetical protein
MVDSHKRKHVLAEVSGELGWTVNAESRGAEQGKDERGFRNCRAEGFVVCHFAFDYLD